MYGVRIKGELLAHAVFEALKKHRGENQDADGAGTQDCKVFQVFGTANLAVLARFLELALGSG
jgi:hypothetical protein